MHRILQTRRGGAIGWALANVAPRLADYDDPSTGTLEQRARAWLEVNCAHCHTPGGRSWNTGLDLLASQKDPSLLGIYKTPTAAGRGTGGFMYDIVPGQPEALARVARAEGFEVDPATMGELRASAQRAGVADAVIDAHLN